ncbi:MAG: TusE/DsrC/DsvC family sulfur relay protein [Thermodesulfobacteriota bacterium]
MPTGEQVKARGYFTRTLEGRDVLFDDEGFLVNPEDWTEELAEALARSSGIAELTELHWRVLRFMRNYYVQNGRAPLNREIRTETGESIMEIERVFPGGIRGGARRLAGLPNPKSC